MHKYVNQIIVGGILLTAAVLRCWNLPHIPFMYDELSAMSRTVYSSFVDLIRQGVMPDFHPAGVQIFLFIWTKMFGDATWLVKLPFILTGIASVFLIYRIGKKWFNPTVGLVNSAFMAALQYYIMYSQLARPYSSGLFLSLLLVWCWSKYFFNDNKYSLKWLAGFVVAASLCMYNHYFSFLFAVMVGLTGLVFLNRKNALPYLLSGLAILLLYIPHLHILLTQLSRGGVGGDNGWLAAPTSDWLFRYLSFTMHYSWYLFLLIALLFISSLTIFKSELRKHWTLRIVAFSWFAVLFTIGYYYSIMVNPVLQFSVLIFVFPFLLLAITSFFRDVSAIIKIALVALILLTGIVTLSSNRNHYTLFYNQPFQTQTELTMQMIDSLGIQNNYTIAENMPPYFKEYYLTKNNRPLKTISFDPYTALPPVIRFRKQLQESTSDYLFIWTLTPEYVEYAKEYYPFMIKKMEGFTFTFYCLSKIKPAQLVKEHVFFEETNSFEQERYGWNAWPGSFNKSDKGRSYYHMDSTMEFGPTFSASLPYLADYPNSVLKINASLSANDITKNPVLVCAIQSGDSTIHWRGYGLKEVGNENNKTYKVNLAVDFSGTTLLTQPDVHLKVYLWNPNKADIKLNEMAVKVVKGNPSIYGLFEPIH